MAVNIFNIKICFCLTSFETLKIWNLQTQLISIKPKSHTLSVTFGMFYAFVCTICSPLKTIARYFFGNLALASFIAKVLMVLVFYWDVGFVWSKEFMVNQIAAAVHQFNCTVVSRWPRRFNLVMQEFKKDKRLHTCPGDFFICNRYCYRKLINTYIKLLLSRHLVLLHDVHLIRYI